MIALEGPGSGVPEAYHRRQPVFIAQDKGYFREAGLEVELKFFDAAAGRSRVATTSGRYRFSDINRVSRAGLL